MFFEKVPVRAWFATLALGCAGVTAFGMTLQNMLNLAPCPFCIFQRLTYMVIGIVALFGFVFPLWRRIWSVLVGLLAAVGGGVAGYQTWMQAFPDLATECSYTEQNVIEQLVDWLGMRWPSMFLATGFCTSKEWVFLGLSMANWSLLLFSGIIVFVILIFRRRN